MSALWNRRLSRQGLRRGESSLSGSVWICLRGCRSFCPGDRLILMKRTLSGRISQQAADCHYLLVFDRRPVFGMRNETAVPVPDAHARRGRRNPPASV